MAEKRKSIMAISGPRSVFERIEDYSKSKMISKSRLVVKLIEDFLDKEDGNENKEGNETKDGKRKNISANI